MMFKNSLVLKKVVAVADAPTFAGTLVPTSPGTLVPTSPGTIVATPVPISTPSAPKSNEISERGNVRNVEDKAVSREHSNARGYQCLSICDSSTFCCVKNNRTGASTVVGDVASNDSQVVGESISNTPYCCSIDFQSFSSVRCLPSCNNESSTFNDCDCSIIPSCPKDLPKLSETCYPLIACCETMIQFLCCIIQCLLGGGGQDNRTGVSTVVADAASNASEAFGKEGGIPKPAFYCSSLGELSCLNSVNCFHCCNKDSGIFNNCDCSIIRSCPDSLSDIQFSVNCTLLMACCENTGKCVTCIIHCIGELAKC